MKINIWQPEGKITNRIRPASIILLTESSSVNSSGSILGWLLALEFWQLVQQSYSYNLNDTALASVKIRLNVICSNATNSYETERKKGALVGQDVKTIQQQSCNSFSLVLPNERQTCHNEAIKEGRTQRDEPFKRCERLLAVFILWSSSRSRLPKSKNYHK